MPLQPLAIALSDGQKLAALKRFRDRYQEELAKVEGEMTEILTAIEEAKYLGAFIGEQPEVAELKARQGEIEAKEKRRQHLGKILERLEQVIPKQADVHVPPPGGAGGRPPPPGGSGVRRY